MSDETLAYCGFDCSGCPIFIATVHNDDDLRRQVAEKYSLEAEKMYCAGCRLEQKNEFLQGCAMRCCAQKNALAVCNVCKNYPCGTIEKSLPEGSEGRKRLDALS
jgi:hypothetical protein